MDRRSKRTPRSSKRINSDSVSNVDTPTTPDGNNDVATPSKHIKVFNPNSSAARISVTSPSNFIIEVDPESLADNCDVASPNVVVEYLDHAKNPPVTPRSSRGRGRKNKPVKGNKKTSTFSYGSDEENDSGDEECAVPMFVSRILHSDFDTNEDEEPLQSVILDWNVPIDMGTSSATSLLKENEKDIGVYKPNNLYEFNWGMFLDSHMPSNSRKETFTGSKPGPKVDYASPYDAFIAIWDQEIMTHICEQTNLYAQQVTEHLKANGELRPQSRVNNWTNVSIDELYKYFAIILAMGILVKPRVQDYWDAKQDIFSTPGFSVYMRINRFLLINKCLHFNNNQDMQHLELSHSQAKLFKLQPILEHLNHKFSTLYSLSQDIVLDESLMLSNGRLNVHRSLSNKATGVGINIPGICEPHTGYLWRFKAHTGSEPSQNSGPLSDAKSTTVLELIQGLEFKGHTLWMSHRYNSPALARTLKSMQFDCVGTLRTSRKFVPPELSKLQTAEMENDQMVGCTSGDVDLLMWKSDKDPVSLISTYHGPATTKYRNDEIPTIVHDYNVRMAEVDKKYQILSMYSTERKHARVWYKKLFRRFVNASVFNCYIMCKNTLKISYSEFSIQLVRQLLAYHEKDTISPIKVNVLKFSQEVIDHCPAEYHVGGKQKIRRVCVVCKKRTHTYCPGCNVTLCVLRCHKSTHTCYRIHHVNIS